MVAALCALKVWKYVREFGWARAFPCTAPHALSGPPTWVHGARVREGSLVTRFTSVERGCTVDCGTTVENASILSHTYLGAGLDVAHAVVCGDRYFSCKWDEAVQIADRRIIASYAPLHVTPAPPETATGSRVGDLLRGLFAPESVNSIGLAAERNISAS